MNKTYKDTSNLEDKIEVKNKIDFNYITTLEPVPYNINTSFSKNKQYKLVGEILLTMSNTEGFSLRNLTEEHDNSINNE